MNRKFLWLIFILMGIVACRHSETPSSESVSGSFPALAGQKLYFEELRVHDVILLDSCQISQEGDFNFHLQSEEAGFYILKTDRDNSVILQLEKNENPHISCSTEHFISGYQVTGSPGSELLRQFEIHFLQQKTTIDSLGQVYYEARGSDHFFELKQKLDSVYQNIVTKHRDYVVNYLHEHGSSLTSLLVLNRKLGKANVIDEEKDYSLLYQLDSSLSLVYPGNQHVMDHHKRMAQIKGRIYDSYVAEEKLSPGRKAPDVVLPDSAGQAFSLKSYTGHAVLIHFWAGWNAPSRRDNLRLKKAYSRYQSKDILFLGVSLDENKSVWKGSLQLDQMPWEQLSDLKGMGSGIRNDFHLPEEPPYYFLLDKDLHILYKNSSLDSVFIHMDKNFF